MSSEWTRTTIGEQATLQRGFDITKAEQRPGTVPVVSSAGVSSWHDTAMARGPGVVLGRKGVVGSVHFIRQDYWPHDTSLWVKDFHGNDPQFVYYFFRSQAQRLSGLDVGSANPTLNRNHVHPIEIVWPRDLAEQKEIARVLGSLDDRITLLRETNTTLEAIAQALFKSWFVDFDPVRAKRGGRAPEGMDEATATFFPDSFEDSELGEAPKGWEVCCVEQIADRIGMGPFGSNIKVETFVDQGVPVLNGSNVQGSIVEDGGFRFITPEHASRLRNSCVQAGDIVITHRGTLGQVAIVPSRSQYPEYVCSQSQFFLRCDSRVMQPEWMLYFLRSAAGQHLLLSNAAQVGVPSIARPTSHLRSMRLLVPPPELVRQYSNVVRSLHESVVSKREHIATLSSLRDTLIPRLISGQLRLPEVTEPLDEALA